MGQELRMENCLTGSGGASAPVTPVTSGGV
jgi:hypothetical protein